MKISNCCQAKVHDDTDICSDCKEHSDVIDEDLEEEILTNISHAKNYLAEAKKLTKRHNPHFGKAQTELNNLFESVNNREFYD